MPLMLVHETMGTCIVFWYCAPSMARWAQIGRTADTPPLRRRTFFRRTFLSRASVFFLLSLPLLVSIPDSVFPFAQGDLYRQAKAATVLPSPL
jgi:hypothetical protein